MKILMETGRWVNIPQEKRIYKFCNDGIGDEFHYLFTCKGTDGSSLNSFLNRP
jgi:hypothetical protein